VRPEPVATFQPSVVEALSGRSFFCVNVRASTPVVFHTSPTGVQRWDGLPLHAEFQARFDVGAVLASSLRGESLQGYLFALGKSHMTTDDLTLGEIIARYIAAHMDQFYLAQQRHQAAIAQERFRLARNLHDGLLQSLASANFRLESLHHLPGEGVPRITNRVREIQHLLTAVQGDLHTLIVDVAFTLTVRLDELCQRIERHWGLRVDLRQDQALQEYPEGLEQEIYFIIHEAMINAARHAQASSLRVELHQQANQLRIVVADNGRGFPFHDRYDLATLTAKNLGPRTLKERVTSLGGSLVVDSSESGARLDITLPLAPPGE
jgi:signal transduction histidine kinase